MRRTHVTCAGMRAQVKTKGARRITFTQFIDALALLAAKSGSAIADVAKAVLAADGPSVTGTKAEYVKFHDDKVSAGCCLDTSFWGFLCCRLMPLRLCHILSTISVA
jgi:hypothetical protein